MSAIAKVMMQQLTSGMDDATKQWLTPDGIKKLGDFASKTFDFFRGSQIHQVRQNDAILANQKIIMEALNVGSQYTPGPSIPDNGDAHSGDGSRDANAA